MIKQIGIYSTYLTAVNEEKLLSPEQPEMIDVNDIILISGTVKNEASNSVVVRLHSNVDIGKIEDITLQAGEVLTFENLPLHSVSIPSLVGQNSGTINVSVIAWSFAVSPDEKLAPKIRLR
jgi:PKD repeat protein